VSGRISWTGQRGNFNTYSRQTVPRRWLIDWLFDWLDGSFSRYIDTKNVLTYVFPSYYLVYTMQLRLLLNIWVALYLGVQMLLQDHLFLVFIITLWYSLCTSISQHCTYNNKDNGHTITRTIEAGEQAVLCYTYTHNTAESVFVPPLRGMGSQ
jgi:hypothetical protein